MEQTSWNIIWMIVMDFISWGKVKLTTTQG
jgi:hypothetical protein